MSFIYIASPYTDPDPELRKLRFLDALHYVGELTRRGQIVYSPIVHNHEVALKCNLPGDINFWKEHNATFLRLASKLHVLQLPGWDRSRGVLYEIDLAQRLFIEVIFVESFDLYNITPLTSG